VNLATRIAKLKKLQDLLVEAEATVGLFLPNIYVATNIVVTHLRGERRNTL